MNVVCCTQCRFKDKTKPIKCHLSELAFSKHQVIYCLEIKHIYSFRPTSFHFEVQSVWMTFSMCMLLSVTYLTFTLEIKTISFSLV